MKEGKLPNTGKPYYWWVCGKFQNLRGQHNWEGKKKKTKNPQITHLTTTPGGEVAQTLTSASREWGLNREARTACLGYADQNALRTS